MKCTKCQKVLIAGQSHYCPAVNRQIEADDDLVSGATTILGSIFGGSDDSGHSDGGGDSGGDSGGGDGGGDGD